MPWEIFQFFESPANAVSQNRLNNAITALDRPPIILTVLFANSHKIQKQVIKAYKLQEAETAKKDASNDKI